jgi:hypothetical protein
MHDENLHPRDADGTGRWAAKPQSAPELALDDPDAEAADMRREWAYYLDGCESAGLERPAVDWHLDREDVAELRAFDSAVDIFVDSIKEGHLSRGVPGRTRAEAASAWIADASAMAQAHGGEVAEFRDGLRRGVVALYHERIPYDGPLYELRGTALADAARHALDLAEKKRATKEEREFWRLTLRTASAAEGRGIFVAAAALSGTDAWWGFRDDPRAVMTGEH